MMVWWFRENVRWREGEEKEREVYQGRGVMVRRIGEGVRDLREVMLWLTLLGVLLSLGSEGVAADAGQYVNQTFTVSPKVNLSSYDERIQLAAYSAFTSSSPGTGTVFGTTLTGDLSNVTVQAVRLRVGSLRKRGVTLGKFSIGPGLKILNFPYVRVILVYRDFGNVSVYDSPVPGQRLVSNVVGIRVYNGDTLSSTTPLSALTASALLKPIQVTIPPNAQPSYCVEFNENGTALATNVTSTYACFSRTIAMTDFALVGANLPGKKSNTWKIILGTVLGVVGLILLLCLLAFCCRRSLRKRRIAKMQSQVDTGETLQPTVVGSSRAPVATQTRTRPMLEKDFNV